MAFPWVVKHCEVPVQASSDIYRNLSDPRGLVCIFNYEFSGKNIREGAGIDTQHLRTIFNSMGYDVREYVDLSKEETKRALDKIRSDPLLDNYDSFILVILSHGKKDVVFYTNDKSSTETLSMDDVWYSFTDCECRYLMNKPKIFLTNFCRGRVEENPQQDTEYDHIGKKHSKGEAPRDMITILSSMNHFLAYRDALRGTIFVQSLCEVLADHAHNTDLNGLYMKLIKSMHKLGGTTPELRNFSFKTFYFNPVRR